jgi:PEP-CTERM motif
MRLKLLPGVVALTVVLVSAPAFAQNLVTNGSFESGYWTGWTTGGNFADTEVVSSPFYGYESEDGSYFALLGPVGSPGTLSQTFSDQAGAQYTFSFYLAGRGDHPSFFSAMWDGTTLLSLTDPDHQWQQYSFTEIGTGHDSISFSFQDDPGYMALDNIVVSSNGSGTGTTPEPSTFILLGSGVLALGRIAHGKIRL